MSTKQRTVIAPGGHRTPESVHTVAMGETVVRTAAGEHEIVAAPQANGAPQPDVQSDYVVAPGGYRHRSLVHEIEAGTIIDAENFVLRNLHPSGEVIKEFGFMHAREHLTPLHPANIVHAPGVVPAFGTGWITNSGWTNNTGTPISSFSTTWVVPPAPTTSSGQTIFLFNGIQNSTMIYQPVLQWGGSAAGGGAYWSVASWYADGPTGHSFHTTPVRVNPGDTLRGVMTKTGQSATGFSYNCEFAGIAGTSLPISNVEQLTWAIETLEAYAITKTSDYPDAFETRMTDINIMCGANHPALTWTAANGVTDCGQHCVVLSNSSANGEVDLCYSAQPPSRGQGLAVYNSHLFAAWKGIQNDDRLFFAAFDGANWTAQAPFAGNSRVGPSLSVFNGQLYAAWKGMRGDQRLFFSHYNGSAWAPQLQIPGVASRIGPSLATFNNHLYAAWRGMDNDEAIWFSAFDGSNWAPQATIPGVASSVGPSLAVFAGKLYACWKGMRNDEGLYWSSFNGSTWAPQQRINGVASAIGPSLAVFNNRLYAGWKGMGNDQGIYYSSFDGTNWAPQAHVANVATSEGPALAAFGTRLFALWKGMNSDHRLFYSSFDGTNWTPQSVLAGNTAPDLDI